MAAVQPKLVVILKARGQMIYDLEDDKHTPITMATPPNVRYASCANFGVCAYGQPDDEEFIRICSTAPTMDYALPFLASNYEEYYKDAIPNTRDFPEFKYQTDNFWTEKVLKYDKYLRFYSKDNKVDGLSWGLFVFKNGERIDLDHLISKTERILLSTLLQQIIAENPDLPIEMYDPGCLKLLSNTEIRSNHVSEPDQSSRHIIKGGRKSRNRKKRKTKRRKML
jgi:hypothetical protein